MVSRSMSKKWPGWGWSHKISWVELCLYDWTGFICLRNFQNWPLFIFDFNRLSLNSPLFTFPAHKDSLPQTLIRLTCSLLQFAYFKLQFFCYSWINSAFWNFKLALFYPFIWQFLRNIGAKETAKRVKRVGQQYRAGVCS